MPISIKREETVALARALKLRTGKPMARVIHEALEERLKRLGDDDARRRRLLDELRAIRARVARLPELDNRSDEEIIGYDEHGLPH
jgi:antitoxin VapB